MTLVVSQRSLAAEAQFIPRPANNEYVVDRVALGQIFLGTILSDPVSIIRLTLYMNSVINHQHCILKYHT